MFSSQSPAGRSPQLRGLKFAASCRVSPTTLSHRYLNVGFTYALPNDGTISATRKDVDCCGHTHAPSQAPRHTHQCVPKRKGKFGRYFQYPVSWTRLSQIQSHLWLLIRQHGSRKTVTPMISATPENKKKEGNVDLWPQASDLPVCVLASAQVPGTGSFERKASVLPVFHAVLFCFFSLTLFLTHIIGSSHLEQPRRPSGTNSSHTSATQPVGRGWLTSGQ